MKENDNDQVSETSLYRSLQESTVHLFAVQGTVNFSLAFRHFSCDSSLSSSVASVGVARHAHLPLHCLKQDSCGYLTVGRPAYQIPGMMFQF